MPLLFAAALSPLVVGATAIPGLPVGIAAGGRLISAALPSQGRPMTIAVESDRILVKFVFKTISFAVPINPFTELNGRHNAQAKLGVLFAVSNDLTKRFNFYIAKYRHKS